MVSTSLPKKKKEEKKKEEKKRKTRTCILNDSVVFVPEAVGKDRGKNATAEQRIYKTKRNKMKNGQDDESK